MQEPRNLNWTHFNQARRFPLLFDCNPVSTDGHFTLPDDLIVSLYLSCNIGGVYSDPGLFYIGGFTYYRTGFVLSIHYSDLLVAEVMVDISSGTMPRVVQLTGLDPMILSGMVVLGGTEGLLQQPVGEWTFKKEATTLDPFCVRYVAKELSEVYVQNSSGAIFGPFRNKITLVAGENIELTPKSEDWNCLDTDITGTSITIAAKVPVEESACIRMINGVSPDAAGNIQFVSEGCLEIRPEGAHTLVFDDTCAEPCCTCTELVPIEDKIKEITGTLGQLTARIESLRIQNDFLVSTLNVVR